MKALIIEDEKRARNLLQVLLRENCPEIVTVEEAPNLQQGVARIRAFQPDVVFLDIEMPGHSGIQILDFLQPEEVNFELIFTTAYSEFAIKAFELNAIDYLLKPLRGDLLAAAVKRAAARHNKNHVDRRLTELQATLRAPGFKKVGLPLADGILFVELSDVILFSADRMYTQVFTREEGQILVSKPLKHFLSALEGHGDFYQPHRSYLINLNHIKRYSTQDGGYIEMVNKEIVKIARNKREEFQRIISL